MSWCHCEMKSFLLIPHSVLINRRKNWEQIYIIWTNRASGNFNKYHESILWFTLSVHFHILVEATQLTSLLEPNAFKSETVHCYVNGARGGDG